MKTTWIEIAVALGALVLGGCGGQEPEITNAPKGPLVMASTSPDGRWMTQINGPDTDDVLSIAASGNDTVALIEDSDSPNPVGLMKVDATGQVVWKEYFTGSRLYWNRDDTVVRVTGDGHIYLLWASNCADTACSHTAMDFGGGPIHGSALVKLDSDGRFVWQRSEEDNARSLAVNPQGEVVLERRFYVDGYVRHLVKIAKDGTELWEKTIVYPDNLALDGAGNVIFSADAEGEPIFGKIYLGHGLVVGELNGADGSLVWQRLVDGARVGGELDASAQGTIVTTAPGGTFDFAGQHVDTSQSASAQVLLVFDSNGTERFARRLPDGKGAHLAVDPSGTVSISFEPLGPEDQYGTEVVRYILPASGFLDEEILPHDAGAGHIFRAEAIAVLGNHSVVVAGSFHGTDDFGTGQSLTAAGDDGILVGGLFPESNNSVLFADDFERGDTEVFGTNWWAESGDWSLTSNGPNGYSAVARCSSGEGYAFLFSRPNPDETISVGLFDPMTPTYIGVTDRGDTYVPYRDHYAAYVGPDGLIHLARRNDWSYTYLANGPAYPSGLHELSLTATGSGPVTLSVKLDGREVIHYVDDSSAALAGPGLAGMFDYDCTSQPFDWFKVGAPVGPEFQDTFNHTGGLGSEWWAESGTWTDDGNAAEGTNGAAYAFWNGTPGADDGASVTLASPLKSTYVGVITRADPSVPYEAHYAAYVAPDGRIHLARRNSWVYSYLADGPVFPSGSHQLGITATGSNPVRLSVTLDGVEVIQFDDSSSQALTSAGKVGMFDYDGSGQPIDAFEVDVH